MDEAQSSICAQDISARYGVLKEDAGVALRGLFIINPEGAIEQITVNNMGIGRNVDEAKRLLQAIQFVVEHGEVRALCMPTACMHVIARDSKACGQLE
jgi:alkyl hydroperoxide reductase subunit AhpC